MKKTAILIYGVACYLFFFVTFLYTIGFIGNILVPKSIDSAPTMSLLPSLAINLGLLALFAVQHSIMARGFFKRWITQYIPKSAERSTYVFASSAALALLAYFWAPLGGQVWHFTNPVLVTVSYVIFAAGWGLVLASTFQIDHFELFGLRQVWSQFRGTTPAKTPFQVPFLYRYVRHPLYTGFFLGMWATPTMTVTHLLFAGMASAYTVIGTLLEERDLREAHPEYDEYAREVPRYVPRIHLSDTEDTTVTAS